MYTTHQHGAAGWGYTQSGRPLTMEQAAYVAGDFATRLVAKSWATGPNGVRVEVSTMFLVTDGTFHATMPPLYETMIAIHHDRGEITWLKGPDLIASVFGYRRRYLTFEDAAAGHVDHVDKLRDEGFRLALPAGTSGS